MKKILWSMLMAKRVLVVDDSEIVLEKAVEALESAGIDVFTALNTVEADRYIYGDNRPDLIIMDVMMPLLDGDVKTKMLKSEESTRNIPIYLLSSKPESELSRLATESLADGYIRKPFTSKDIIDCAMR